MNRRTFIQTAVVSAASAAFASGAPFDQLQSERRRAGWIIPTNKPDRFGLKVMAFNPIPAPDPTTWSLTIEGLAREPLHLSAADVERLPRVSQSSRLKCVQCWSARVNWGGFRFGHLLEVAKPSKSAKAVRIDCADKWYEYFSIQDLLSNRVLMALDLAGKPLPDKHGAPLRLIDPSRYGYKSAKLITSITFVEEANGSMACDIGPYYSPTGEILAGYDTPLDLGGPKRKISGGEITGY